MPPNAAKAKSQSCKLLLLCTSQMQTFLTSIFNCLLSEKLIKHEKMCLTNWETMQVC